MYCGGSLDEYGAEQQNGDRQRNPQTAGISKPVVMIAVRSPSSRTCAPRRSEKQRRRLVIGAQSDHDADDSVIVHPLCEWSRARTGEVRDAKIETPWVYDTSTAYAIL